MMSSAFETTSPHLKANGKRRPSKKDSPEQLRLLKDNGDAMPPMTAAQFVQHGKPRWTLIRLSIEREHDGTFVHMFIRDEHGFELHKTLITGGKRIESVMIEIAHTLSKLAE